METIKRNDTGEAVLDVQERLRDAGFLADGSASGVYDDATAAAVRALREAWGLPAGDAVDEKTWAALVDASFSMGDRSLFLRMPYFHGRDVVQLQEALAALGFSCGVCDGIFGAYTEDALRKFQMNMGLPADGIVGALTWRAIANLHHSWEGKPGPQRIAHMGFARAADVLEANALCLFGTNDFTRQVASRMSNLALATNAASKIVSAETLLVPPDDDMLLVHIVVGQAEFDGTVPFVTFDDEQTLALRLRSAVAAASRPPRRIALSLPKEQWEDAGQDRSAQHYAISLLDALCAALEEAQGE